MASLREFAKCIGIAEDFSLVRHFFGHLKMPAHKSYSLCAQMKLLEAHHIHLNLTLVGNDAFSEDELDSVNTAVFEIRRIYSQVQLGVGRVLWFEIPVSMANGHEDVSSDDEAVELTNSWTNHNNGLDVFIVRNGWTDDGDARLGLSDQGASCDKDAGKSMSGSVISVDSLFTGVTLAHEVGHDLGLDHVNGLELDDVDEADELDELTTDQLLNLMFPFPLTLSPKLTPAQGAIMKMHCLIQLGC